MPPFSVSASRRQSLPTVTDRPFEELKGILRRADIVVSDENIPPYKPRPFPSTVPSSPTQMVASQPPLTPKVTGHVPPPLVLQTPSAEPRTRTLEVEQKRSVPLLKRPVPKSFFESKRPEGSSVFRPTLPAAPAPIIAITPAPPASSSFTALLALLPPKPAFYNATGMRPFSLLDHLDRLEEESEEGHSEPMTVLPTIVTTSSSFEGISTADTLDSPSMATTSSRTTSPSPSSPSSPSTFTASPTSSKRKSMFQSVLRPIKSATDIMTLAKSTPGAAVSAPTSGTSTPRSSTPTIRSSTPTPSAIAQALSSAAHTVSSVAQASSSATRVRPTADIKTASKKERSKGALRPSTSDGTLSESTSGQRFKWTKRASWVPLTGVRKESSD